MSRIRLNKAQRQAVEHDLGPLLVLAGAGSGKTGVVTQRIARLISKGVPARAILAMTFTNKAAAEMQERVVRLSGARACKGLLVCTFHRFGLEVLSKEPKALGLRGSSFAIFDRGDCAGLVRDALRLIAGGRQYDVGAIINRISLAKNAFLDADGYAQAVAESDDEYDEITSRVFPRYAASLQSLQAFDFDDLVCEPVRLWRRRPDVLDRWRSRFRYLIVDEYQDTNHAQLEMLRLLATDHRNLCVVGDDDQAIYAWRGADVRNILDFDKHFTGAKIVRLERNYRSSEAILAVANSVLRASSAPRHVKRLIATRGAGVSVKLACAADGEMEAGFVAEQAQQIINSGDGRPADIAVLYRSNLQAGEIESALKARAIPYQLFGAAQTFERKEVKDVLAYLAVAVDPASNELALRRSLNYPPRGVGEVGLRRIATHATAHSSSLFRAVEQSHAVAGLSAVAREGCRAYCRILGELQRDIDAATPMAQVVSRLVEALQLRKQLWAEAGNNNKAAGRRWSNIIFLLKAFERRDADPTASAALGTKQSPRQALAQFLRLLMLRNEEEDADSANNKLTLTTMHGAKGLEFRYVFLVGLEEGLIPHARTIDERATDAPSLDGHVTDEVEQERRLFYVAVTRAREQLFLCHATARPSRGKLLKRAPSRFLLEIPDALIEPIDVRAATAPDIAQTRRGADGVLAAILAAGGSG